MPETIFIFAESLRLLLDCRTPETFDRTWAEIGPESSGWTSLSQAWRRDRRHWEAALDEIDGLLLKLLDRVPVMTGRTGEVANRVRTFRMATLERLQHATAAALVAQRYGIAGLRTVLEDQGAPAARRYFAFFAIAERHPPGEWDVFAQFLRPEVHHAFVGAAAEAARYYPDRGAAHVLVMLFERVRSNPHLRSFLGPRILESLFVLNDPTTLPFFRGLLTSGYTHANPLFCEVTRALVMVCCFTGHAESSVKFSDDQMDLARELVARADEVFRDQRDVLHPVKVI